MFTICVKFKTKTLSISEIYGYENEIMKGFFFNNRKWASQFPVGNIVFDISKGT